MNRPLRWMIVPSLLFGTSFFSLAEKVSLTDAEALAKEFVRTRTGQQSENVLLKPVTTAGTEKNPVYYVFNVGENNGFVIVSAESATTPIVGFSFNGSYPEKSMPDGMKWMLSGIEREIKAAPSLQSSKNVSDLRMKARKAAERAEEKVLPTAKWSQEGPFNSMIPGRPLVGCVGTAMSTIMKYHEFPAQGTGSFGDVDFNVSYDWSNMRTDNYRNGYSEAEADAVATLMYHASKSIDTQYAMSGSSAYEVRVPAALSTYFGYDPGVSYKKRSEVASQEAWDNLVKDEIDAGRPVLYCGQDVTAGHAFVCDGYRGEYLHFNWGWGGSADGFFLSTMLNPAVSRTHYYNNLNTIIYNIKPGSNEIKTWSPIHITGDGNQAGIGSDLTDLASGQKFTVRVGNLKNLSYNDFKGKIAVALCGPNGAMKALLSTPVNFTMQSMGYLYTGYQDFFNCQLPSGTNVASTDRVRIMTQAEGSNEWLPVAGELYTLNELEPTISVPASFRVSLPSGIPGITIEGEPSVIRGWKYSFKVNPLNAVEDVVTVKANGVALTANGTNYSIDNVREDQNISVLVQKASEVKAKRSVWVGTPGTLSSIIGEDESGSVKELTLFGTIDARDFEYMNNAMNLTRLDISGVTITANGSNQANALPREAFRGKGSLQEVVLPSSLNRINNGAFRQSGITTIAIPSNVSKYEYNVFVGCSRLRDIYVGRTNAEFINWCVLSGVKVDLVTLHVPNEAAKNNYSKAENWNTIANIIVDPIVTNDNEVIFAVMDNNEVKFETEAQTGKVAKGTAVAFSAQHIAENDNNLKVYANNALLTADANGVYSVTVNSNTIIHFELESPIAVDSNPSKWILNDKNGSIGLLTDAVNVLPGQEFSVRVNAVNIPKGYDQAYWGVALTDAAGNIKEFISPVNVWTAGPAENHKFSVNCKVSESTVREGNKLCLVTSFNKRNWNIVKGTSEAIVDALPALNNVTPVYNINVAEVKNATVSGVTETAVRGRDMTLKIVPTSAAYRVDLKVNGVDVLKSQPTVSYPFVAMEDMNFEANVYDPKADGEAFFTVAPGTFHNQLTADNVAATVKVKGRAYSLDIGSALGKDFAINTIKTLDLTEVEIVGTGGYEDNVIYHPFFTYNNLPASPASVVENILLPKNLKRIMGGIFSNCGKIKEVTLPESLSSAPEVGFYASGSKKYTYSIADEAFKGCNALTTIYIPGAPATADDGTVVVCHHNPYSSMPNYPYSAYNLGHPDPKKVTIIVPEEYLSLYQKERKDYTYGNPWKAHGYNILSEYPVYGVNFDPTRVSVVDDTDITKMASFLGDNVSLESVSAEGKLKLANPAIACKVFDNGEEITPDADGFINVEFFNPAKKVEKAGNHQIDVVYSHDVTFNLSSDLFALSSPEVANEKDYAFHAFDTENALKPVLKNVAENSEVRFKVEFKDNNEGLEARVMNGNEELVADEDGLYSISITNAGKTIEVFAVPGNGASLNAEEIAAINPEESAAITDIALEGEMTPEELATAMNCFPNLETLDLSALESELPEGAFSGMESLATVILPEVEEIPENLFRGCGSLQSVDIPATVNVIGDGAFGGCSSLETLRITGISSIGKDAFKGCDNLTTITILADNEGSEASMAKHKTRKASAIHSAAFNGVNPNCIVVLDNGVEVPQCPANYLLTSLGTVTETDGEGNVIEREGRVYNAAGDINLVQGHPLAIPHAFTLDEGAVISLETDANGWTSVVVPFDVETITDETSNDFAVTLAEEGAEYVDGNVIYALAENGEKLVSVENVKANTPCFVRAEKAGKMVFAASNIKVGSTPAEIKAEGKDFSLHASYSFRTLPSDEVYVLNDEASAFLPAENSEETVEIRPFEIYATSPVAVNEIETKLPGTNYIPTSVEENELGYDKLTIANEGGIMVIYSPDARKETIYRADGSVAMVVTLKAGRNVVDMSAKGIYILNDVKVIF